MSPSSWDAFSAAVLRVAGAAQRALRRPFASVHVRLSDSGVATAANRDAPGLPQQLPPAPAPPLGGGSGQVVKLPAIGKTGLPPVGRLPKISAGVAGQGSGSGFRSAGYTAPTSVDFTPAVNSLSVREAAAAAAASQKNMLKGPEETRGGSPEVSAAETKAFIDEQRRVLVAKKNAERKQELQEWNVSNMNPLFDESSRPSTAASVRMRPMAAPVETNSAGLTEEEQAAKREALRLELAKKMRRSSRRNGWGRCRRGVSPASN